jgi:hypothetical protein
MVTLEMVTGVLAVDGDAVLVLGVAVPMGAVVLDDHPVAGAALALLDVGLDPTRRMAADDVLRMTASCVEARQGRWSRWPSGPQFPECSTRQESTTVPTEPFSSMWPPALPVRPSPMRMTWSIVVSVAPSVEMVSNGPRGTSPMGSKVRF